MSRHALALIDEGPDHLETLDRSFSNFASSVLGDDGDDAEGSRDEVKELEKFSRKETHRVRTWRLLVTLGLVVTGTAVTITANRLLVKEQEKNFGEAFDQFSRTLGDAAFEHQLELREASSTLAHAITGGAIAANATWPFYRLPNFEVYANDQWASKNLEVMFFLPVVYDRDRAPYEEMVDITYEGETERAHLLFNGNTDSLQPVGYNPFILKFTAEGAVPMDKQETYWPVAQWYPPSNNYAALNWDVATDPQIEALFEAMLHLHNETLITGHRVVFSPDETSKKLHQSYHSYLPGSLVSFPHAFLIHPVFDTLSPSENSEIVGCVLTLFAWDAALRYLLPEDVHGIIAVVKNNCGDAFTYDITGKDAYYLGDGDLHSSRHDGMVYELNLAISQHPEAYSTPGQCQYRLSIYPSDTFESAYVTNTPKIFSALVASTFFLMIVVFYVYDWFVQRRNRKLVINAAQSNEIVTSMFPGALRDKVMEQNRDKNQVFTGRDRASHLAFLARDKDIKGIDETLIHHSPPVAELFLNTTVLFCDIVGFTAWSSTREPPQVFMLLETIYSKFDEIAKQRRVFKVETVGDCYVAVTGFPNPQPEHATAMCRFAQSCVRAFAVTTKQLEVRLGPDTGELSIRVGMHSGQVTAGVLRGERARFQLFGDTVNTAARMESTSKPGSVHMSKETADLVINSGRMHWLNKRQDIVDVKGKGMVETFWLTNTRSSASVSGHDISEASFFENKTENLSDDDRLTRLVEWNVATLLSLLEKVFSRRKESGLSQKLKPNEACLHVGETFLDEVKDIIELPEFDGMAGSKVEVAKSVVAPVVATQLRDYVFCIANMYRDNTFHNFEHASHVSMSVMKLLARIVAPTEHELQGKDRTGSFASTLHDHTYGITSDPLTQFACAFSALIHDVDHTGVPNTQLIVENPELGSRYRNRSVAEQNSIEIAWNLLMDERFVDLRSAIYTTDAELQRFRELVVNSVLATDIIDKDLKQLRNNRWDQAFKPVTGVADAPRDIVNRKATIVIEHLIQASDVAHTMQHWHVYRKWNERLFKELYAAFRQGRSQSNPADFWAKGEIGFFDFYVIPLAKKLKECGVFGVSSDEYLNYALANRQEWLAKGEGIVAEMLEEINQSGIYHRE